MKSLIQFIMSLVTFFLAFNVLRYLLFDLIYSIGFATGILSVISYFIIYYGIVLFAAIPVLFASSKIPLLCYYIFSFLYITVDSALQIHAYGLNGFGIGTLIIVLICLFNIFASFFKTLGNGDWKNKKEILEDFVDSGASASEYIALENEIKSEANKSFLGTLLFTIVVNGILLILFSIFM